MKATYQATITLNLAFGVHRRVDQAPGRVVPLTTTHLVSSALMERTKEHVSVWLEGHPEGITRASIQNGVPGKAIVIRQALDVLVAKGNIVADGPAGRRVYRIVTPYRRAS